MAKQGKGKESTTKAALKKAKRVAAKARQDLAGVFTTESGNAVFDIDLDAVEVSPTQIPKKPIMIPAPSLAPHFSPEKDQATLKKPSDKVMIPAQSTAPPHNQDSVYLSVPTINSRLNYDTIPIKCSYLIDVEN